MRSQRYAKKRLIRAIIILFILIIVGYGLIPSQKDRPVVPKGKKVHVTLPNGTVMTTYDSYIIKKNHKLYYKSEFQKMDITGSTIAYNK
jgi:hypothetical protein